MTQVCVGRWFGMANSRHVPEVKQARLFKGAVDVIVCPWAFSRISDSPTKCDNSTFVLKNRELLAENSF